jgi:uncharacterized protein (DUF1800 family)
MCNMAPTVIAPRDPTFAAAAHLVRRTSLGVHQGRVADLADRSWDDAIDRVLDVGDDVDDAPATEDWGDTASWWLDRMTEPETGLRDRMAWFWHGLLTTNAYKVSETSLLAEQLDHFRRDGLGNFRDLLHGYVTGGALLDYLDASWSMASNPNENLARELMELFTIGRGHYNEDDVRAAARALAGWVVQDGNVEFRRENAFIAPLIYLGEQAEWDTAMVVDRLCDHPATAVRLSSRLWNDLVGQPLADDAATDLGSWWQDQELEIAPLVERILRDPAFAEARLSRPKTGLEWYCGAASALGFDDAFWYLESLGQMPYLPPNVAGWPTGDRWLAPGSLLARASLLHSVDIRAGLDGARSTTEEVLDRCAIHEVSADTVGAMNAVARTPEIDPDTANLVRWRLALSSPEFNLS